MFTIQFRDFDDTEFYDDPHANTFQHRTQAQQHGTNAVHTTRHIIACRIINEDHPDDTWIHQAAITPYIEDLLAQFHASAPHPPEDVTTYALRIQKLVTINTLAQ